MAAEAMSMPPWSALYSVRRLAARVTREFWNDDLKLNRNCNFRRFTQCVKARQKPHKREDSMVLFRISSVFSKLTIIDGNG
jgi:hypothetical protein